MWWWRTRGRERDKDGKLSPDELQEQQGLQAELLSLFCSLPAQRAAVSSAEGKVREWEAKEGGLRRVGEGARGLGGVECGEGRKKGEGEEGERGSWRGRWLGWRIK